VALAPTWRRRHRAATVPTGRRGPGRGPDVDRTGWGAPASAARGMRYDGAPAAASAGRATG